ncbi:MAG TPA: substrate-binding domain-containing protein [Humisphaera sp.]|nr:substrate-binding domain-containing protein [Humisphaera sp.]
MRKMLTLIVLAGALSVGACDKGPHKLQIAVIPKGTTHVFWKSVEAGAEQASKELGVEIIWKGPLKENDRGQQIAIVEQFVGDKVGAIVLAPLDDSALVTPVQEAAAAKIPVVIIDSALKGQVGKDFVSYVATDNLKGGELAGEQLAKLLNGKGKVVLLRYQEGSASTTERESGFLSVIKKNPDMSVLSENRFAGATANEAQKEAMNMLDQLKAADGVFCPNESSTFGMLLALRQAGLAGKIKFVGFDATPQLVDALKAGDIDALVAQDPVKMGYEGVKAAVAAVRGQTVSQHIDTGVRVITKPDLADPVIQKLIGQ